MPATQPAPPRGTRGLDLPLFLIAVLLLPLSACTPGEDAGAGSGGAAGGEYVTLELEASYPEAFSYLSGVRELRDGSVLAADPLSQVLLRLDLATGAADTLGRVGEGPQEYQQPDLVLPLPADSTLLVDIGKTQLTTIAPDGAFQGGTKLALVQDDGNVQIIMPRFVDDLGRLYYSARAGRMGEGPQDSLRVARFDREREEAETLATIWMTEPIITRVGEGMRMSQVQMAPADDWAAGPDGSLAIVRADGYRVEWHRPDGTVVKGPPTEVETPALTNEDKYAYLANRPSSGLRTSMFAGDDGSLEVSMSRGGGGGRSNEDPNLADYQWAESYPPFRPGRARIAPSGELWVERWLHPDQAPVMDIFGRDGVKAGSVKLPPGREVIGWGTTAHGAPAVYLARSDEFDLRYLERYEVVR